MANVEDLSASQDDLLQRAAMTNVNVGFPDYIQVYAASQSAALANVMSAIGDPVGGPNFRPGTVQIAGARFYGQEGTGPTGVVTPESQAATDQMVRLQEEAQTAINTGPNGVVMDEPTPED